MADKKRLAVLASGFGSNLQAIIDQAPDLDINGEIVLVFSNNENAYALERAQKHGIKSASFNPGQFESRQQYDKELLALLKNEKIDLIVMAGYLLLVGPETIREFSNRIINIHPALLPSFKGIHGIKDAFDYGVKVTGVTVHFVEEELDAGPIISQEAVIITEDDTIETLEEKIHKIEHKIYPLAVKYFCNGRLAINGRKVEILKGE
ncbi:MAG: phosphoribosylglycinamide formyltransferase [Candidatus Atribacteria bacterium]|nr:phosphoribosylglycinamide formyltransferase [Candidatus Atribacteria bacterium]